MKNTTEAVEIPIRTLPELSGVVKLKDWKRIYWSNLCRISNVIDERFIAAAIASGADLFKDQTKLKLIEMYGSKQIRLKIYEVAKEMVTTFEPLSALCSLIEDAVFAWSSFKESVPEFKSLDVNKVKKTLEILHTIHEKEIYPKGGFFPAWKETIPVHHQKQVIEYAFESIHPLSFQQIAQAHMTGAMAYRAIPNITPLSLFAVQLPILAPDRLDEWSGTASYIADVLEVGKCWYSFVECRYVPTSIEFYREFSRDMLNK